MKKNKANKNKHEHGDAKSKDLEMNRADGTDQFLTTNQGLRINDNQTL